MEIALGRFDVDVAEVRREPWQQPLDIAASTIPSDNSMDRSRVSNVVDAWRKTFGGANDTGCSSDVVEQGVHMRVRPASARLRCKETRIVAQRQGKVAPALQVGSQFLRQLWTDRHEPCLEELRVANRDDLFDQVDIAQTQVKGLADAQPASVKKNQQHAAHGCLQRSVVNVNNRGGLDQPSQLIYRIDIRRPLGRQLRHVVRQGRTLCVPTTDRKSVKAGEYLVFQRPRGT